MQTSPNLAQNHAVGHDGLPVRVIISRDMTPGDQGTQRSQASESRLVLPISNVEMIDEESSTVNSASIDDSEYSFDDEEEELVMIEREKRRQEIINQSKLIDRPQVLTKISQEHQVRERSESK